MNGQNLRGLVGQGMDGRRPTQSQPPVYAGAFTGTGMTPAQSKAVRAYVYVIGAGGSGAGAFGAEAGSAGGGGGATYDEFDLMPGQRLSYSVATGAINGGLPNAAADTIVTSPSGRSIRAQGGQGRIGGRGIGGKRNFTGGDGGLKAAAGPVGTPGGGPPGAPEGGDGSPGGGGQGSYGGGGGGAASPGLPAGILASLYPPGYGQNGTNSGGIAKASRGGGGGGNTDTLYAGGDGGDGIVVVVMMEVH